MKRTRLASVAVLALGVPLMLGVTQISNCGLNYEDFTQIASGGVDDRLNSYPWAMELFDGDGNGEPELYIGTVANALCIQVPREEFIISMFPDFLPPERWQCRNDLWDPNDQTAFLAATVGPAYVYRGTHNPDDSWTWDRVWSPNYPDEVTGFRGARVFNGALYMLGNRRSGLGACVWKTTDGVNYEQASPGGMGYPALVTGLRGSAVYKGKLYVASDGIGTVFCSADPSTDPNSWQVANSNGFVASGGGTHEQVYYEGAVTGATANTFTDSTLPTLPTGLLAGGWAWARVTSATDPNIVQERQIFYNTANTFYVKTAAYGTPFDPVPAAGDTYTIYNPDAANNAASWQLAVANGHLYASTYNFYTGAELWKSDDPAPGNWTQVIYGAYGNSITQGYMTVEGFGDHLYLGTVVYPPNVEDFGDFQGCEILRVDADDNVEVLVGMTRDPSTPGTNNGAPLSGLGPGFDYTPNTYCWYTGVHDGWFYVGTYDFAGMVMDILDDYFGGTVPPELEPLLQILWGSDELRRGGFDLWRTKDGINWVPVILDGFGDHDNYGIRNMESTPWGFVIGVANAVDGFEVYIGNRD